MTCFDSTRAAIADVSTPTPWRTRPGLSRATPFNAARLDASTCPRPERDPASRRTIPSPRARSRRPRRVPPRAPRSPATSPRRRRRARRAPGAGASDASRVPAVCTRPSCTNARARPRVFRGKWRRRSRAAALGIPTVRCCVRDLDGTQGAQVRPGGARCCRRPPHGGRRLSPCPQ